MAMPLTPQAIQANVRFTWNDQQVENVLNFLNIEGALSVARLDALGQLLEAQVGSNWLDLMHTSVTFREVYLETYAGPDSISWTVSGSGSGVIGGTSEANNVSFCLSLRSPLVGRARRGRFYTIGMPQSQQSGGVVIADYRVGWLAALNTLRLTVLDEGFQLIILSTHIGTTMRDEGLVTPCTSIIAVNDFTDSQRRRLQGRGQ